MTKQGHRSAVHNNEIRKEHDAYEAENSRERARIKEDVQRHREREQQSEEAKKYESEEKA